MSLTFIKKNKHTLALHNCANTWLSYTKKHVGTIHRNLKRLWPISSTDPFNATFMLLQTGSIAQAENFEGRAVA